LSQCTSRDTERDVDPRRCVRAVVGSDEASQGYVSSRGGDQTPVHVQELLVLVLKRNRVRADTRARNGLDATRASIEGGCASSADGNVREQVNGTLFKGLDDLVHITICHDGLLTDQ